MQRIILPTPDHREAAQMTANFRALTVRVAVDSRWDAASLAAQRRREPGTDGASPLHRRLVYAIRTGLVRDFA